MNPTISSRRSSSFISSAKDHPKPATSHTRRYSTLVVNTPPTQQRKPQQPQHKRQPRRSSLTALTASARAKLVVKHPEDEQQPPRRSVSIIKRSPVITIPSPIEDDDDNYELMTTALLKQQRQQREQRSRSNSRRQSLLLVADAEEDNDENNDTFWKELVDIKTRLKKLEVKEPHTAELSASSSSCSSSVRTPSSPASPRPTTVHQRRLSEAMHVFEQELHPDPLLARSLATVVAETIAMNQRLWSAATSSPTLDARTLVAMQKSSDMQLRELTETLAMLSSSSLTTERRYDEYPATAYYPRYQQHRRSTVTSASSLTSSYYSRYYGQQQQQEPLTPPVLPRSSVAATSGFIRPPVKVAGILDYNDTYNPQHQQQYTPRPKSYYEPSSTLPHGSSHFGYGV